MVRSSLLLAALFLSASFAAATALPAHAPPAIKAAAPLNSATVGVAATDSTLLLGPWGSGAPHNGQFQTVAGGPAWNDWTSLDLTEEYISHWHVDTYNVVNGTYSAWCGSMEFPACGVMDDVDGGYGHNWYDGLLWGGPVADPALPCTVRVQAVANIDLEPGLDYLRLHALRADTDVATFGQWSLRSAGTVIDTFYVYQPGEYAGVGADEVRIDFRVSTDGAWDDEDCNWGTQGAVQLDDVVITLSNGTGYGHDFEDGTLGAFTIHPDKGLGDFAAIRMRLRDLDPCAQNPTPQMAFIDDGVVVPGTGGSPCLDWCYGPGGWIVYPGGGPYEREENIFNVVVSPPLALAPGEDGLLVEFDIYLDNPIDWQCVGSDCPSHVLGYRNIRSVATGDPADLPEAPWSDQGQAQWSPVGDYQRYSWDLSEALVPGATHVQLSVGVVDIVLNYEAGGRNGTPAPYYDNVRVTSFVRSGPTVTTLPKHLARDGFPAQGHVDLANLGTNSVRFDMIDGNTGTGTLVPHDSLLVDIDPRDGAAVIGTPRLHYRLFRNEVFDPHRTAGMPDLGSADLVWQAGTSWTVDLPDEGFLFPGDRLHYCFTADDDLAGDVRTSILPADTTGFSSKWSTTIYDFPYDPAFTMRALPTVSEDPSVPGTYVVPPTLLWHDSGTNDDWAEWRGAIHQAMGAIPGEHFDTYDTKTTDPDARVLRATVTAAHLDVYDQVFYAGGLENTTLEADLPLVESWLQLGNKDLLLTGHRVADDLEGSFTGWSGTAVAGDDLRLLVDGQMAPRTRPVVANPVLHRVEGWLAFGQCPDMAPATAVTTTGNGLSLAQYLDPTGTPDTYPYSALILNVDAGTGSRVITLPWDFAHVHTDPVEGQKANATDAARVRLLGSILAYFGVPGAKWQASDTPVADSFAISPRPNPFNPSTTISYTIARPGHLLLRIFDLRGALVTTLVDGRVEQAGKVAWHGRNDAGAAVASGVYFYEARMNGDVQLGKLALLK